MSATIRRWRFWVVAVSVFFSGATQAAELRLVYAFNEEQLTFAKSVNEPKAEAGKVDENQPQRKTSAGKLSLVLGKTYLLLEQERVSTFFDFAATRIYRRVSPAESWSNDSLYSDLAFRVAEYQNRQAMNRVLSAASVKDPYLQRIGEPFELETLFCLRFPDARKSPPDGLKREEGEGNEWRFRLGDEDKVVFKPSGTEVPGELRPVFERALVYLCHIHPEIRRQIAQTGKIPRFLRTHWMNAGTGSTTTWTLETAATLEGDAHAVDKSVTKIAGPDEALDRAIADARDKKGGNDAPTLTSAIAHADGAVAAKRPLDGLLALFEIMFQTGDDVTAELKRLRPALQADAACKEFFAARDQSSKEACERSVVALRKIDRTGLAKAYIIDIHVGDGLSTLGKSAEAEQLFLSVLKQNPLIVGVWKDLGQVYHRDYRMDKAWRCWDIARDIGPQHPMMTDITQFEGRLEADFPDFFLFGKAAR